MPKPVVGGALCGEHGKVVKGERAVAHDVALVTGQCEQLGPVFVRQQPPSDRLGRSLPHLIETVGGLEQRGVGFRSITEAIDTTTSSGRLVFHLFGALGQFERDLIRERTRAGLDAAAARGRKGGRRAVVTAEKLERARVIIAKGLSVREAAMRLKVGKTALYEALRVEAA